MALTISLVPQPVSIQYRQGLFQIKGLPPIQGDEVFHREIQVFKEQLQQNYGGIEAGAAAKIRCSKDLSLSPEAYRLSIEPETINLYAACGSGIYHGLQTLRQLILSEYRDGLLPLPCVNIEDHPRFGWRGFMLDTSRHFYTPDCIKNLLDALSLHHINRFHWHLTDDQGWRLPVPSYPLLTEIGSRRKNIKIPHHVYTGAGFYTEADIQDIVAYAQARHIEVIPEIDIPGHASAILACYPGLGCTGGPYQVEDRYGIFEDVLCAGNDAVFDFAAACFDALVTLFPSQYVHIGGDEVWFNRWNNCPKCQKRLAETGLSTARELQSWITVKLAKMLADRGKTAIGWDEVLEDTETYKLPKEVVVMSWRGSKGGIEASGLGHPVIMSPNSEGCYLDYKHYDAPEEPGNLGVSTVYQTYTMDPITPEMSNEAAALILGGQCNLWSELIYADRIAEYMTFPRICALSEGLWTPKELKDFDGFAQRLEVHQKRLDQMGLLQYRGYLGKTGKKRNN
ncbi:MAG: beta-N-acetylhexosaminidase [Treponema sp.]|jgi:hexosaminidase|nr:beta-N-acetylhexosaminidase [Treponema sp.]